MAGAAGKWDRHVLGGKSSRVGPYSHVGKSISAVGLELPWAELSSIHPDLMVGLLVNRISSYWEESTPGLAHACHSLVGPK